MNHLGGLDLAVLRSRNRNHRKNQTNNNNNNNNNNNTITAITAITRRRRRRRRRRYIILSVIIIIATIIAIVAASYNSNNNVDNNADSTVISMAASKNNNNAFHKIYAHDDDDDDDDEKPRRHRRDIHDHSMNIINRDDISSSVSLSDMIQFPLPIFDLSLPYSNGVTSLLSNFFQCLADAAGDNVFRIAQTYCSNSNSNNSNILTSSNYSSLSLPIRENWCGLKMLQSIRTRETNPWSNMLQGNYSFYGGLEMADLYCLFPQDNFLVQLHKLHPKATFVINTQSPKSWYQTIGDASVLGAGLYGFTPLEVRLSRCLHKLKLVEGNDVKGFRGNTTGDYLMAWHEYQTNRVRDFVRRYNSHNLIEINMYDEDVGSKIYSAFFGKSHKRMEAIDSRHCLQREHLEPKVTRIRNTTIDESVEKMNAISTAYDATNEHEKSLDFWRESQEKLLVPTPVFVLGLPKAGTTSIDNFFRCHNVRVAHNLCNDNPFKIGSIERCGRIMVWNLENKRPMFDYTGSYDVYAQFEDPDLCFFPQVTHLKTIHEEFPNATFILNMRNLTDWVDSLNRWRHKSSGFIPLSIRLTRCFDQLSDYFQSSLGSTLFTDNLMSVYQMQIENVRKFVKLHPSHHLVEISIDDENAGGILRKTFLGNVTDDVKESCWGQKNQNRREPSVAGAVYDYGVVPQSILSPKSGRRDSIYARLAEEMRLKSRLLKVETPILFVGLPFLPTYPLYQFFSCKGIRSASDYCSGDAFDLSGKKLCSKIFESNLRHGWNMLFFAGEYDTYTTLHGQESCFFPQITHLDVLHYHQPNATLLLNTIDVNAWLEHLKDEGVGDYILGLDSCLQILIKSHGENKDILERLQYYYEYQVKLIRSFVEKHPSHRLIEIDISNSNAVEVEAGLRSVFFGEHNWKPTKRGQKCYNN